MAEAMAENGAETMPMVPVATEAFERRRRWPLAWTLCAVCTCACAYCACALRPGRGDTWAEQAEVLQSMALYQKVRLLRNLSDRELHRVDVVSLPAILPGFWSQRELRRLGFSASYQDGKLTITSESQTDVFIRVSLCITDAALIALKLMAALLSLEASIHVCELPMTLPQVVTQDVDEQVLVPGRRLAFNVFSAFRPRKTVLEAKMSCASQINAIISSFSGVSQYISDSVYTCPPPNEVKAKYSAKCSMGLSLVLFGVTKAAAALADIAVECKDPTEQVVPYSKNNTPGREGILLAACLNNIGQAMSYTARTGYQLNTLLTSPGKCPKYPSEYERYVCAEQVAGLLADIGQVSTYLSAAAAGCGNTTLVPFSCSSRIAGTVTGLFDVVQGLTASLAWCDHPGSLKQNISALFSSLREKVHDERYKHTINLTR